MVIHPGKGPSRALAFLMAGLLLMPGCRRADLDGLPSVSTPAEAASQVEAAFGSAPEAFRTTASAASAALRSGDLTKAVEALGALRTSEEVNLQQGMAVHNSLVLLEARLIAEAEGGDPKAREAYALLKRLKQK